MNRKTKKRVNPIMKLLKQRSSNGKYIFAVVLVVLSASLLYSIYYFTRSYSDDQEAKTESAKFKPVKPLSVSPDEPEVNVLKENKNEIKTVRKAENIPESKAASEEEMDKLLALGYMEGYKRAEHSKTVTIYDREKTFNGLNFYVSGHAPEAILMDMQGAVIHKWKYQHKSSSDDEPGSELQRIGTDFMVRSPSVEADASKQSNFDFFKRAALFENGDILAIHLTFGLLKLDKESNLLWRFDADCHHDFHIDENGSIHVLTREIRTVPGFFDQKPFIDEFITILTPQGKEIKKLSLFDCFKNSSFSSLLQKISEDDFIRKWKTRLGIEIFHANAVEVFEKGWGKESSPFQDGNALVSLRLPSVIAVIDLNEEKAVWMMSDMFEFQHDPTLLENGNILLFDNLGGKNGSRILEFDPYTQKIRWSYAGSPEHPFFSKYCGTSRRLPGDNTLITDSLNGRAFEVTRDKEIVWEFYIPHRVGKSEKLIATLFDMIRLPADFPLDWLGDSVQK